MVNFIIRKVLLLIPMMLVISFLIYAGIELMPGDAVDFLLPPDALATMNPQELEILREELGLNDPFLIRFFNWLVGILHGDFGYSIQSGVPVSTLLANTLPATLELSVAALFISTLFGTLLGVVSALKKGSIGDNILTVAGMIGVAIPQFLFGLIMIIVFVFNLGWLPVGGRMTPGHRASMLDSLGKDFIKTARSKGLPDWRVNLLHGLRVALSPVVVLIGFRLPMLIGGAVVIEQVFQWPGVGQMFVAAVRTQNTPVIMMVAFFSVLIVLIASILIDIVTALLDPRVKLS